MRSYFRGGRNIDKEKFNALIDENRICINELILSEIAPSLIHKRELGAARLLRSINTVRIDIDWEKTISFQTINFKNGLNHIGIPDLIIMQNTLRNNLYLFTQDKHFRLLRKYHKRKLF